MKKYSAEQKWEPARHLKWEKFGDEVKVMDEQEGKIFRFNGVGALIWQSLDGVQTVEEIVRNLRERFDAPEKQIRRDVIQFLKNLHAIDLIATYAHA